MNRFDIYIIIVVCILSIMSSWWLFGGVDSVDERYVVISVDGREVNRMSLKMNQQLQIKGKTGISVVEIRNEKARILEGICPDKICINSGWISYIGESIICLPERISVVIEALESDIDTVVY